MVVEPEPVLVPAIDIDIDSELIVELIIVLDTLLEPPPMLPPKGALGTTVLSTCAAALLYASSLSGPWLMTPTIPSSQWSLTAQ